MVESFSLSALMLFTLLNSLPSVVHIISTELEIPLTAVTVQPSVSGSPIVKFPNVSFPSVLLSKSDVLLSNMVICIKGVGTT